MTVSANTWIYMYKI